MKPPFTFAERLADLMAMTGLSNSTVARICGIDKSNVTHYLKGDYEAKQDVIFKLAARCQVSPVWLMGYNVPIREEYNPYLHNEKHAQLVQLFDMLPPESQDLVIAQLQGAVQALEAPDAR